jgi:hypothetical protein
MHRSVRHLVAAMAVGITTVASAQAPKDSPVRIRGDVVSLSKDTLVVHRRSGDTVSIALQPDAKIAAVRKIALADIKPGSYVGTAAKADVNGNLVAQEVVLFPESERGAGEGHYAWDLGAHSTMTNANVDSVVTETKGNVLQLSYKGGNNTITVPPSVPVVTIIPASRADLVAGKKVFVLAAAGAGKGLSALNVVVEKDGMVPPM